MVEYVLLSNGLKMPRAILGSFNISDQKIINEMIRTALAAGVTGFDTSPSYGSEKILGKALEDSGISRKKIFLTDKIDGWQMYKGNGDIEKYVDESLCQLGTNYIDLLLIHWPLQKYLYQTWKSMEDLYMKGRVRAIGLCNVNARIYTNFLKDDIRIKPHAIQIEISPFRTANEDIKLFQDEGILVEAYSPLCRMIPEIRENAVLKKIAEAYHKSVPQIILRWHIERGIVPVFTSSKPQRIIENLEMFNFEMLREDIDKITALNIDYKIFPESYGCPGY